MASLTGQWKSLSAPRRFICDLMRASRGMPIITFERRCDFSAVIAARKQLAHPPAWALLFAKAFAVVAARQPELRRAYLPFPWPHVWEADESIASIAIERDYHGEPGVFFGIVRSPDQVPLTELMTKLNEWKTQPVEEVRHFWRLLRFAKLPGVVRRLLWCYATAWSGKIKARNFGTFGVSLTGASGATGMNLISPLTTSLNCGVIQPDGTADVRLHFDHRVLDGMPAARALEDFEHVMWTEIVAELRALESGPPTLPLSA